MCLYLETVSHYFYFAFPLFDQQYDSAPKKVGISDSMRQKLMAEASTGLDSEKKQDNVILYIIGAVSLLVLLGGQGIFY